MNILTLIKSAGVRNFAKLLSANVVAQVIGLIVYPILTRIYSPEDFGLLNLFLSIGGVLTILSTAEYYYAIVLPKERKDAVSVLCVGLILLLVVGVLIGCSVFFLDSISMLLKSPLLKSYYWMMPIYVCLMGGWNLLNYWYIRNSEYSRISGYQISQSVLSAGGKIGLGYAGVLQGGMIYSVVFAPLISLLFNLGVRRYNAKSEQRIYKFQISWSDIFQKAKEFKNFPLLVLPRSVVNVLVGQMPILLLTPFFGSKMVGLYSLALLLGYTPIGTITRAVYQVLYQQTMKRVHQTKCIGSIIKRFIIGSSLIIIPLFLIASFILPELTGWLFGEEIQ